MEDPPKKVLSLAPGKEVSLKYAYYVTCKEVIKDKDGEVQRLFVTMTPNQEVEIQATAGK